MTYTQANTASAVMAACYLMMVVPSFWINMRVYGHFGLVCSVMGMCAYMCVCVRVVVL